MLDLSPIYLSRVLVITTMSKGLKFNSDYCVLYRHTLVFVYVSTLFELFSDFFSVFTAMASGYWSVYHGNSFELKLKPSKLFLKQKHNEYLPMPCDMNMITFCRLVYFEFYSNMLQLFLCPQKSCYCNIDGDPKRDLKQSK